MKSVSWFSLVVAVTAFGAQAQDVIKCEKVGERKLGNLNVYVVPSGTTVPGTNYPGADNVVLSNPRLAGEKVLGHFRKDKSEIQDDNQYKDQGIRLINKQAKETKDGINENEIILGTHLSAVSDMHLAMAADLSSATLRLDFSPGMSCGEPVFVKLTCSDTGQPAPSDPEALHAYANQDGS